jgi:uncharacterized RDD family membrane protein YckC
MKRILFTAAAFALLAAPAASAKEGAEAHLLTPLPIHSRTGTIVTVRWTVDLPGSHGRGIPFGAIGMFARLVGTNGATTTATAKQSSGPFTVRIRVPSGGIRQIRLGLEGTAMEADGTPQPAPILFPTTQ